MRNLILVVVLALGLGLGVLFFRRSSPNASSAAESSAAATSATGGTDRAALSATDEQRARGSSDSGSTRASAIEPPAPTKHEAAKATPKAPSSNEVIQHASDIVDPKSIALDDAQLDEYLTKKYEGWSKERMTEAIMQLKDACRVMEATPELLKTQYQEYTTMEREIGWLKAHRE